MAVSEVQMIRTILCLSLVMALTGCMTPRQSVDATKVMTKRTDATAIYATVNATYPQGITYAPQAEAEKNIAVSSVGTDAVAAAVEAALKAAGEVSDSWAGVRKEVVTYDVEIMIVGTAVDSNALRAVERVLRMPVEADRPAYLYPGYGTTNGSAQ